MKVKLSTYSTLIIGFLYCLALNNFAKPTFEINQFRAPYSLSEMLHDGLVFVQNSLGSIVSSGKENSSYIFQLIADKLQDLENLYGQMYAKSMHNEIRRDQREFLQKLIDRIDQMIQQLENDEPNSSYDQELIKKNLDLLHNLKDQINS
jgi:hypothetical protein